MRFTFAILLSAIAQTIVSALPIADVQHDLVARDEFDVTPIHREYDGDLLKRDDHHGYQVALHRSQPGTVDEHWSLQFHPHPENTKDQDWHEIHAVSNAQNKGVLPTSSEAKKFFKHGFKGKFGSDLHHVIGEFDNYQKAQEAFLSINKDVNLEEQFPKQNCVDCTKMAVDHMVQKKFIKDDDNVKGFHEIHEKYKDIVRQTTGTPAKMKAAGVPKKPEEAGGSSSSKKSKDGSTSKKSKDGSSSKKSKDGNLKIKKGKDGKKSKKS